MAMATYLNLPEITVAVFNATTALVLDYKWLLDHGFSCDEVEVLRSKADSLRREMNVPLKCILWDSSKKDDVIAVMEKYGKVVKCETAVLSDTQVAALNSFYSRNIADIECTVIEFQLEAPQYLPLKFAQQPQFAQTAAIKKALGKDADKFTIPANFLENTKLNRIF